MAGIRDYSTTAASNTSVGGISTAEGMNPSAVNDAIRALMADLAAWRDSLAQGTSSGTVGGTVDAITLTVSPAYTAYAVNNSFLVKATGANTSTAPTLNVNGLGAKTIKAPGGGAVVASQWATNDMLLLTYNGTDMILLAGSTIDPGVTQAAVTNVLDDIINAATEETTAEPTTDMLLQRNTDGTLEKIQHVNLKPREVIVAAVGDEATAITTGAGKITFRMPFAMTLTAVRGSLSTAQTSGSIFTVDVNESGTTILSTKLTIDNTEKTSVTAATAAVISDTSLADDAEITIDIDQVGDGTAKGLKVALIGYRT